jgi:hypothetical protein
MLMDMQPPAPQVFPRTPNVHERSFSQGWEPYQEPRRPGMQPPANALERGVKRYGGPHVYDAYQRAVDALNTAGEIFGFGADVQEGYRASGMTADAIREGRMVDALEGTGYMTAAMLGLGGEAAAIRRYAPATAGAAAERVLQAAENRPSFTDWRSRANPEPSLFAPARPDVPQYNLPRYEAARGTSQRMLDAMDSNRVRRKISQFVDRGLAGGADEWYNTEALRRVYVEELGEEAGTLAHRQYMEAVGATSPRMPVPQNIAAGSYYNWLRQNDMPLPESAPAPGYGSISQKLHIANMENAMAGGLDVMANPKPASFVENLSGNYMPTTIDTHNMRAPGIVSRDPEFLARGFVDVLPSGERVTRNPYRDFQAGDLTMSDATRRPAFWDAKPRPNEYGPYEAWQQDRGRRKGVAPAQYQAAMWQGAGEVTGLKSPPETFLTTYDARVKFTADTLGMAPTEVLKRVVRGEMPLLSIPAAGAVGAAAAYGVTQQQGPSQL